MPRFGRAFPQSTKLGKTPAITFVNVTPGAAGLALTGFAPVLTIGRNITVPFASLALTGFAPSLGTGITPAAGALTLTGFAPIVNTPVPPGALTLTGFAPVLGWPAFPGAANLTLTGFAPTLNTGVTPGAGALTLSGFVPRLDAAVYPGAGALTLSGFVPRLDAAVYPGVGALSLTGWAPVVGIIKPSHRLRADVYDVSGAKLAFGAITSFMDFSYTMTLDQIGSFKARMPATDERAAYLDIRYELRFTREGEGEVFRGIIDRLTWDDDDNGNRILSIEGSSTARKLVFGNTLFGRSYSGSTLAAVVADLLSGETYTAGALDIPTWTLAARFDGASKWAALAEVAKKFVIHIREDNLTAKIDMGVFGTDTGIVFQNVGTAGPLLAENTDLFGITKLRIMEESSELWNSIIPQGSGTGINAITLKYSTRSVAGGFAYDIQSAVGPDGQTYYYLEDAASVASYGRSTQILQDKTIVPLTNDLTGWQQAANALYDETVTYLQRHKTKQASYMVQVAGITHLVGGLPAFKLGQKVTLRYQGVAELKDGTLISYKNVNAAVYIMGFTRKVVDDGSDQWTFTVSTIDQAQASVANQVSQLKADVASLQVGVQPVVIRDTVQERRSIDASHSAIYEVDYDANVTYLWQAKVSVKMKAVRSNVSTSAAGGGTSVTSAAGAAHTHTITPSLSGAAGGGTTVSSAGGSAHSHSVSGTTTGAPSTTIITQAYPNGFSTSGGSAHNHSSATTDNAVPNNPHQHAVSGASGLESAHTHTLPDNSAGLMSLAKADHTHSVTGSTSGSEALHTHSVTLLDHTHTITGTVTASNESTHTHSVTLSDHTHALVYGIYDGSAPVTPAVHLTINGTDRSVALGGPWNADFLDVDITQYLKDANGQPLRQRNTLTFTGSELIDLEVRVKSLCMISPLRPV